jgi:hypothetical protein
MRENPDRAFRGLPITNFWYAERDTEQAGAYQWTPVMQADSMSFGNGGIWFATQRECEEFIRDEIGGAVGYYEVIEVPSPA